MKVGFTSLEKASWALLVVAMAEELKFIVAGCGHVVTSFNLGGNCSSCGKLCCKDCLTTINDVRLCQTCFKKRLRGDKNE